MPDIAKYKVPVDRLRWFCDPNRFSFSTTTDLIPLEDFIGQDRAIRAIETGLAMNKTGYNIFVTGMSGTGKTTAIRNFLLKEVEEEKEGAGRPAPRDWCYIYNIQDPDRPKIISLPKGQAREFQTDVQELLQRIKTELTRVFSGDEYEVQQNQITEEKQEERSKMMQEVEKEATEQGFFIQSLPQGITVIPQTEGRPMSQAEFFALPPERREELENKRSEIMQTVVETLHRTQAIDREIQESRKSLDRQIGEFTLTPLFTGLFEKYQELPPVVEFLKDLKEHALSQLYTFREQDGPQQTIPIAPPTGKEVDPFLPFRINVFVDNSKAPGPPVVIETNPTYGNMFGKIERKAFMGAYYSDHTMLKPGALAAANGGYLVLNIKEVLQNPGVWEGLKRSLKNKEIRLEDPYEQFGPGVIVPQGLRPEPIPLDLKVVVIGDGIVYQTLSRADEDFWEIFKIKAEFDYQVTRTDANLDAYARFISGICVQENLLCFDSSGVAKIMEYGARMVEDQEKLSSRFGQLRDIIVESDHWARQENASEVQGVHVQKAIEERIYRVNLIEERIRDLIAEGTILLDLQGSAVGQVNGLAVLDMGDYSFGRASRITARTYMGRAGVINIERESQLSGRTHDKGVMILSGYLGWKFAQTKPLNLAASICFEQSYDGIDGDSASSTELYALLSSLSGVALRQDIAVTGSVNQKGEVQPIGGVNQKVEGFFDVSRTMGLTGTQGVMIPHQNVRNLMLREDVVDAVREGKFHIYAVKTIDEGIEVLTGGESGVMSEDGTYPEGTINYLVDKEIKELAEGLREFSENHRQNGI